MMFGDDGDRIAKETTKKISQTRLVEKDLLTFQPKVSASPFSLPSKKPRLITQNREWWGSFFVGLFFARLTLASEEND